MPSFRGTHEPHACLGMLTKGSCCSGDQTPIVLLHGFDSSALEFRRLFPLLREAGATAYAVDLVGWGFSCCGFHDYPDLQLGPQQKTDHLYAFWREKVRGGALGRLGGGREGKAGGGKKRANILN